ncbi:dormancy-associated protein 2-like [Vicia villosa]|uniref:dormancy-associated protein 2-like n=1 Tax=Vicia villosa TaxID=3911 RepID=UPI00273BEF18|nr:dormancy-associated protein 2-like [Vicia villosa]
MDSKNAIILILGFFATIFLISSEVSARDLTETSSHTEKEMMDEKTFGGVVYHGGYYDNGYPGNGGYFGGNPRNRGRYNAGYDGGYGGYNGRYGGGYPGNYGGYNGRYGAGYPGIDGGYDDGIGGYGGEVVDGQTKDNTHN